MKSWHANSRGPTALLEEFLVSLELARQEIQKNITKLVLTPKQTPAGVVLAVSGDVGLFRGADVMLQNPVEKHHSCPFIASRSLLGTLHRRKLDISIVDLGALRLE